MPSSIFVVVAAAAEEKVSFVHSVFQNKKNVLWNMYLPNAVASHITKHVAM